MTERLEKYGRPVQTTEIGATSGPYSFIENGGLPASPVGEPKAAYRRLDRLKKEWGLI